MNYGYELHTSGQYYDYKCSVYCYCYHWSERRLTNLKDVMQKIPFCIDMVAKFLGPVRFPACVDCGDLFVMGRKQNI